MTRIPEKSLRTGFSMPAYGMGTWQMGGRDERDPSNDDAADIAALRRALDLGVRHFDTAESYAAGRAEELLGEAIKGYDRSSLLLVSKASSGHHRPEDLRKSLCASLDRLGTDYLDVYMLHRYDSSVPIGETMSAMDELIDEGLVRNPAVSNFTVDRFERAQSASRHRLVANQLHYNLEVREPERHGLVSHHQRHDVLVIAWRPVQKGGLAFDAPVVQEMAAKYGRTPVQIAINWLVSQSHVVTLAKTRNANHLEENLEAVGWTMEPEDVERLRAEMPGRRDRSDAVPLDYD